MPWRSSSPMDLRTQFIADYLRGVFTISELSCEYQISRKTAYKWIDRYAAAGAIALVDRSRRPHHSPQATPPELIQALLSKRRRHPHWGAKKLLKLLSQDQPDSKWPARSTACDILRRHDLVRAGMKEAGLDLLVVVSAEPGRFKEVFESEYVG